MTCEDACHVCHACLTKPSPSKRLPGRRRTARQPRPKPQNLGKACMRRTYKVTGPRKAHPQAALACVVFTHSLLTKLHRVTSPNSSTLPLHTVREQSSQPSPLHLFPTGVTCSVTISLASLSPSHALRLWLLKACWKHGRGHRNPFAGSDFLI